MYSLLIIRKVRMKMKMIMVMIMIMIMMMTIISLHPHNAQHNKIQELHIGDFYQERITEETFLKKVRFWTSIAMSRKIHEFGNISSTKNF